MNRYHVTFYYLATGMEGRALEKDHGMVNAGTPEAARQEICDRLYGGDPFALSCLNAKEVVPKQPAGAVRVVDTPPTQEQPRRQGKVYTMVTERRDELRLQINNMYQDIEMLEEELSELEDYLA
jgi:hypothetical protein